MPIPKADEWAERIAAQQRSGISVKQFCKEQGLTEYSFYAWRKRLQKREPVRFALVDRRAARQEQATDAALDLVLTTGERLRIGTGVDAATCARVLTGCTPWCASTWNWMLSPDARASNCITAFTNACSSSKLRRMSHGEAYR